MGKVSKKALEKHNVSLSPAFADFIQKTISLPLADLPLHLRSLSTRWPFPRGDLYNWIETLDRFDSILETFNLRYGLNQGAQIETFGNLVLLEQCPDLSIDQLKERGFGAEGDRELVESILNFSRLLLDKCGNRALYNSTDRLNDLLNTTSLSLLENTLRLTIFLAHRYSERNIAPPQPHSSFYNFDSDRIVKLAAPFVPYSSLSGRRSQSSKSKSTQGKDKITDGDQGRRDSSIPGPNDFRALAADTFIADHDAGRQTIPHREDWRTWASVKVVWSSSTVTSASDGAHHAQSEDTISPSTPTPAHRQGSVSNRTPTSTSPSVTDVQNGSTEATKAPQKSGLHVVEFTSETLLDTGIYSILRKRPENMPVTSQYELLHKLRVAFGLMDSSQSRLLLLRIRLLSLAILAYIFDENEFPHRVFPADANPTSRLQLVQQIVSLLQDATKATGEVSLCLQTLAMECLGVLAHQRLFSGDIIAALAPNSNHGLMLLLTQRGLEDLRNDDDNTDNEVGDDWRDAVFSLPLAFITHGMHSARQSETIIHPSLVAAYASAIGVTTGKAMRVHLRILNFMKSFFHHFKDGLQVLSANHVFEAACGLLDNVSQSALDRLRNGEGIPSNFKTKVTDYQIPYMHQQVIRSMIELVIAIVSFQGGHAERILRNLVDAPSLLNAFKLILSEIDGFGAHTWSEVVKAVVGFLHNEPTSYTVIAEAGIISILLGMVSDNTSEDSSRKSQSISAVPSKHVPRVPAVADAIVNISQAFGAICLTNAGFETFQTSGALEAFFEIFESPEHVKVIKDANTLAMLGSTFDELVRHHPSLKEVVLSTVIIMVARVRNICRSRAWTIGAGPKLWLEDERTGAQVSGGADALTLELVPRGDNNNDSYPPLQLPNGQTLEIEGPAPQPEDSIATSAKDVDADELTVIGYARPAICFLMNFFENQSLCTAFMEAGASDLVLDFTTLPSLPPSEQTFAATNGLGHELPSVIHMMAETKPALILPAVVDRLQFICAEGLSDFITSETTSGACYFQRFIQIPPDQNEMQIDTASTDAVTAQGTKLVKGMTTALLLIQVLSEIFNLPIYSTRTSHNLLFMQVNIADMLSNLVRVLGHLNAVCYREEIALQSTIPDAWLLPTRPDNFSTGHEEVDKILNVVDPSSTPTEPSLADQPSTPKLERQETLKKEKETTAYKNAQMLRYLLIETPNSVTEFFQRLGRGLAGRRRLDTYGKQKASFVAESLAEAYTSQLRPRFLSAELPDTNDAKRSRFGYLVVALSNVRGSLYDDSPTPGPSSSRQAFVIDAFRRVGGLQLLNKIGTEFFDELKSCEMSQTMFSANAGLKICLDILDDLTGAKYIVDSSQATFFRSLDASKPFYFNPSQLLLELRLDSLPLTRKIWASDYADQASTDVIQKLILILKQIFEGDHESDAIRELSKAPKLLQHSKRKFTIDPKKVADLKAKGFSEDLACEAIFRCNTTISSSPKIYEEYCRAMQTSPRRRRLHVPNNETELTSSTETSGMDSPARIPFGSANLFGSSSSEGMGATLAEVVSSINDMDDDDLIANDDSNDEDDDALGTSRSGAGEHTSSAMDLTNILNEPEQQDDSSDAKLLPATDTEKLMGSVEAMDAERESIREDLAERCNNILSNHQNLTFELSELMISATKKLSSVTAKTFWENTADLLMISLLSMHSDTEINEVRGKQIAAAAHLTALIVQDNEVFRGTLKIFQDSFESLVAFLKMPHISKHSPEESAAPWIAPVLLIVERMLSLDAEPVEVVWHSPSDIDTKIDAEFKHQTVVTLAQKESLFSLLMDILPKVGKDKSMAVSIVRILVTLTRNRSTALLQSRRGNLQRLFLMIKQLGSGAQGRLQNSFMLILRHIIEDDDTIRQIMQSEIVANFTGRSSSRQHEMNNFVRDNYHLALRSPEIFVEVANEKVKLLNWQLHSNHCSLALKEQAEQTSTQNTGEEVSGASQQISDAPKASVEDPSLSSEAKVMEYKVPTVEHQDGLVHFLLSELLAYKEIEDKEPSSSNEQKLTSSNAEAGVSSPEAVPVDNGGEAQPSQVQNEKQDKPRFKADDHPIFLYRCFILHCLTELLHSYNRTKVEFINFSRKADPNTVATPSKPRSGILNYLLNALVCSGYVDKDETLLCKKKMITSDWAIRAVVALCSRTGEMGHLSLNNRYASLTQIEDKGTEHDLMFVRRFALEHAIKSFKDATTSTEPLQAKYSRLLCLGDLFQKLLAKPSGPEGSAESHNTSYKILGRMMFEKNLISVLTCALTEIDLSYPSVRKVIKFILRPLQELTSLAADLSMHSPDTISSAMGNDLEEVISSASSVSDMDDAREETPDLFRNSALGMLDPSRQDESNTSEDEDDEDEEMYDDEYDEEMDYDEGMVAPNDGEVVSDEEIDEEVDSAGQIEGISGDQPMDIEFVMDDHMDDTDSDHDEDDEEDGDGVSDGDGNDEHEDFEVQMDHDIDDAIIHEPLEGDHDEDDEWEDEIEDEDDEVNVTFEGEDLHEPMLPIAEARGGPTELNTFLRVLGEHDLDADMPSTGQHQTIGQAIHHPEHDDDDDEDEDEEDEGEDMDENEGLEYDDDFNAMLEGDDLDGPDQWGWDEPPPNMFRRHRHSGAMSRGHLPFTMNRRIHAFDPEFNHLMGGNPRRHLHAPPARSNHEDTLNPLLQRPETSRGPHAGSGPPFSITVMTDNGLPNPAPAMGVGGGMFQMQVPLGANGPNPAGISGHGALLDAILSAVTHNSRGPLSGAPQESFRLQFSGAPDLRDLMRSMSSSLFHHRLHHHHHHHHQHHGRQSREDPGRVASFTSMTTSSRWHEEARMLFGSAYTDKLQRIQTWLLSLLVPAAQEEERERRVKRAEEDEKRRKEAEEEKARAEAEKTKKEEEDREAAERIAKKEQDEEEAVTTAAAAVNTAEATEQARDATEESSRPAIEATEQMEDVQAEQEPEAQPENGEAEASIADNARPRVFTTIRGQPLDITDLEIDRDYLEALPEELREEVIMQQYTERRQEAREEAAGTQGAAPSGTANASGIDPDFLDALPEDIREEIRQQEAHMQRRRDRETARLQAVLEGTRQPEEMDNDNFLATLEPHLRRTILGEQPPEVLSTLDPRHAAEGRAQQRGLYFHRPTDGRDIRNERSRHETGAREKRQVVQLIDKAGVATLLRLMFLPQQGSLKQNLWQILRDVSGNKQTRFEVISLLLVILKEGSTDVTAVERSLANLSLRAKASTVPRTPQPLKRTLSMQPQAGLSEEMTPMVVVQQCLAALSALCRLGFHVKTIFLREVDVSSSKGNKKGKSKETKVTKYPINDLIGLLEQRLIMESSTCLQALSELLSAVTQPLELLMRKDKEKPEVESKDSDKTETQGATVPELTGQQTEAGGEEDTAMTEAPATDRVAEVEAPVEASTSQSEKKPEDDGGKQEDENKKKQPFEPPVISEHNLRLITSVFVTPDCHTDTFHHVLDIIKSLSHIPGTSEVFSKDLISHVQSLSKAISADLDELLPLIREAESTSDLQGITSAKFSASSSDQVKLLRVLQALDYLSAPKKDYDNAEESGLVKSILNDSYHNLGLGPLWNKLSECLTAVREKGDTIGFANILLALIESLMVVCKNTPLRDAPIMGQSSDNPLLSPRPDGMNDLEELFFNFTTEHRKILNDIVRQSPKLMQGLGNFSLLVKNSKVLDFDNKRNYFTKQIHSRHHQQRHVQPPLQLSVRRDNVFLDSYKNLYFKTAEEMKNGKLNIRFVGEEGVDAGGVTREWFQVLARGMFDANYALFQPVASDRTTFHPNNLSGINEEHLVYFKFIGRIIGKALHEGRVLDCHFSRAVYKRLLGKSPNLKDLESNDVDYYKSLVWILENDITDILTEEFCVIENEFGEEKVIDLIPDGRNIAVTEENKKEYVQKLVEYRLTESVKEQLDSFLQGFYDIIPAELIGIFNEQELELLISGLPEIDVDDWKANSEYHNYSPSSPQVVWFWRIVRGMSNEERAKLLQFITGTSKVPLNGFKELEGVSGLTKFNIHKDPSTNRLPTSHTCFNQLDLPAYDSFEILKQNIMTAINLGADYFGFA